MNLFKIFCFYFLGIVLTGLLECNVQTAAIEPVVGFRFNTGTYDAEQFGPNLALLPSSWNTKAGIKIDITDENVAIISGTQDNEWNYVSINLKEAKLIPNTKYKLEGWMKIESLSDKNHKPKFKLQVNDVNNNFYKNYFTNIYDTGTMNIWQKLYADIELDSNADHGFLSIEKSANESVSVIMNVRDLFFAQVLDEPEPVVHPSEPAPPSGRSLRNGETYTFFPANLAKPIFNQGYGFTIPNYWNTQNTNIILNHYSRIAYKRFSWAELEPVEGQYKFSILNDWINQWASNGYRVGFGIYSTTNKKQATPLWLFDSGVPGVIHMGGEQIDPVYWDTIYLEKLGNFIRELGNIFDNNKNIEFIDMRGIGVYGEMHLGNNKEGFWTPEELEKYEYTNQKFEKAYKRMIDDYKNAFSSIDLFLNISPNTDHQNIVSYAVDRGINLRYDGLCLDQHISMAAISEYFNRYGRQVKCCWEFGHEEELLANFQSHLDKAFETPLSYLNLNFTSDLGKLEESFMDKLQEKSQKIGYRFELLKIQCKDSLKLNKQDETMMALTQIWKNTGTAKCFSNYGLNLSLKDQSNNIIASAKGIPKTQVTQWYPGAEYSFAMDLPIPTNINENTYHLEISMYDPDHSDVKVKLAIEGENALGSYVLFPIEVTSIDDDKIISPLTVE